MNVLVIAPHPDDEVIGCGGTIARLIQENHSVFILILTKGMLPLFTEEIVERARMHALKAHQFLGIKKNNIS
jgi:LmbE family N-acetylglucosaminyl deacetylase